ncbi:MAG TPA: hypothetical protein VLV16_01460 [Gemmatimonadales bacterium]|nr:hypothetical protein [Gemmatimonadales bacterium]
MADNDMHVLGQHSLRVDMHTAAAACLKDGVDDVGDVDGANRALPPPSVPGEVGVEAEGFVHRR